MYCMIALVFLTPCMYPYESSQMAQWIKNLPVMQETQETDSVPGSGGSPDGGHGNLLQYSCPMDRGAWQATVHMFTKSWV